MGFGQALSGLNAAAQNLDVIGNNIANASTVGYKSGGIAFADVYASSRIGLGVQIGNVTQRFSTGNLDVTGNQYDMAIDGANGFFRLVNGSGEIQYSRNGQFIKDKNNAIVNAQGLQLTGYPADVVNADGSVTSGVGRDPIRLAVPLGNIPPQPTTSVRFTRNLNAGEAAIPVATAFSPTDPKSFSNATPITVYDSLGNAHSLTQYYVKRPAVAGQSVWDVYYALDGKPVAPTTANAPAAGATAYTGWGGPTQMTFSPSGVLTSAARVQLSIAQPGSADSPAAALTMALDYTGSTSHVNPYTVNFDQNGYTSGEFASISVTPTGGIIASYTNGQTRNIGTLALAGFNNPIGLRAVGGNAWVESPASGQAILGQPGSNGLATIKGQTVEASNVDMSQELVNMIIAQRTYQANAQTIKTQDQIMQTLMQMR